MPSNFTRNRRCSRFSEATSSEVSNFWTEADERHREIARTCEYVDEQDGDSAEEALSLIEQAAYNGSYTSTQFLRNLSKKASDNSCTKRDNSFKHDDDEVFD